MLFRAAVFQTVLFLLTCAGGYGADLPQSLDRYTGRWELNKAASDDIDKAIDKAVSHVSFVIRAIARSRLKKRNAAFPHMTITRDEAGFRVVHEQGLDVLYRETGREIQIKALDGAPITGRIQADPVLTLTYVAEDGTREDRYILSPGGAEVSINVKITSPRLPVPLEYKLVYSKSR